MMTPFAKFYPKAMLKYLTLSIILLASPVLAASSFDDAWSAFRDQDYKQAAHIFKQLADSNPDDTRILYRLALSQYKAGQEQRARATVEKLLRQNPRNVKALYLQGIVSMALVNQVSIFHKSSMGKQALEAWRKAVQIEPGDVKSRYALFSYYAKAPSFAGGDLKQARRMIPRLRKLSDAYGDMATGVLYAREKEFDAAEKYMQRAASKFTDGAFPYFALSNLYLQQKQYQDALQALRQFNDAKKTWRDPNKAAALYLEGRIRADMHQTRLARLAYNQALNANPNAALKNRIESSLRRL